VPDFNTIADVSLTLRSFLKAGLSQEPDLRDVVVELHDLQDPVQTSPARVTLFQFEVVEDATSRNSPRTREPHNGRVDIRKPLLKLALRYLITPWSGSRETDQRILGRILQLFHESAIMGGEDLQGAGLSGTTEQLKVRLSPLTLEEQTRIWNVVPLNYRLSATYEVRVVNIVAKEVFSAPRVSSREIEYGRLVEEA
jgi:hypothetical protein